jgi:uncharacterized protein YndB with AHSA1/START domain
MRSPDGQEFWNAVEYHEIVPHEKIEGAIVTRDNFRPQSEPVSSERRVHDCEWILGKQEVIQKRASVRCRKVGCQRDEAAKGDLLKEDFWTVEVSHSDEDLFLKTDYFSVARNRQGEARGCSRQIVSWSLSYS